MLAGQPPFDGEDEDELFAGIKFNWIFQKQELVGKYTAVKLDVAQLSDNEFIKYTEKRLVKSLFVYYH